LADDASGVYYNPAGLADVRFSSLSLSASLYGFERTAIDQPLGFLGVPGVENLDVQFADLIVIPASAGFVNTIGEPGHDGLPQHSYGVSVMVPSNRSSVLTTTEDRAGYRSYNRRVTDRELWSGVGYGRRITRRLRLGLSFYYVLRSVTDREDVTSQEETPFGDRFDSVVNDITLVNGSLLAMVGLKYHVNNRIALGVVMQSPSVGIHSQADLRFTRLSSDPTPSSGDYVPWTQTGSTFDRLTLQGAESETGQALVLRVGVHFKSKRRYTLACDASLHAPVTYNLLRVGEEFRERLPFNPEIERQTVVNLNLGAEYLVVREVSLAMGMFTNFSSAKDIPSRPIRDQPPKAHLFGVTMALGYFGKHSLSRFGFVFSAGSGDDVIPTSTIDRVIEQRQEFERVAYSQSFFYVFFSSTFRY
jgi:hypothetical protein